MGDARVLRITVHGREVWRERFTVRGTYERTIPLDATDAGKTGILVVGLHCEGRKTLEDQSESDDNRPLCVFAESLSVV